MTPHVRSAQALFRFFVAALLAAACTLPAVEAQEQEATVAMNPMPVDAQEYLQHIKLPRGFTISIYAEVKGPREMALSDNGTLFVGTGFAEFGQPPIGKVYAIRDNDSDHKAEQVHTLAEGLNYPNGVALKDGDLYVAEISRILRFDDIENNLSPAPAPAVVTDKLPTEFHHGWKFIAFGPDGRLYVPVGAPCNMCEVKDLFGTIISMKPDGSDLQVYARGVRNTVGFDWHPETKELWFSDNGRDGWGNDRPPEELNHAPRAGMHFGFPYRYGRNTVDDTFRTTMKDEEFTPAALELPAHRAGLGMQFYTGQSFPAEYRNQVFLAHHGSWNRNPPDGYRVVLVRFKDGKPAGYEDFASGWLTPEQKFWGRPVDVEIAADGSLLVSDDFANVIYRISYGN